MLALVSQLAAAGLADPVVAGPPGHFASLCRSNGIEFVEIVVPREWHARAFRGVLTRAKAAWSLRSQRRRKTAPLGHLLDALRPDVVHLNSALCTWAVHDISTRGLPLVWHIREFGPPDYGIFPPRGWTELGEQLRGAATAIFVSNQLAQWYESRCGPLENGVTIYNGVFSANRARGAVATSLPQGPILQLLFAGLIRPEKGVGDIIFGAWHLRRKNISFHVNMCGSGWARPFYQALTLLLGLRRQVTWHGFVSDIPQRIADADFVLVPSHAEAMGRVTAEAMWGGRPIVARSAGATVEVVGGLSCGTFYKGGGRELAASIQRALASSDHSLSGAIEAQRRACREFNTAAYAAHVAERLATAFQRTRSGP